MFLLENKARVVVTLSGSRIYGKDTADAELGGAERVQSRSATYVEERSPFELVFRN